MRCPENLSASCRDEYPNSVVFSMNYHLQDNITITSRANREISHNRRSMESFVRLMIESSYAMDSCNCALRVLKEDWGASDPESADFEWR